MTRYSAVQSPTIQLKQNGRKNIYYLLFGGTSPLLGGIIITGEAGSAGAAALRYALNSAEMTEVVAVRGTARLLEEKPVDPISGTSPSLYQRRFDFTGLEVIRGSSADLKKVSSIRFSGFTMLAPAQRGIDSHSPTLRLEGQTFFDSKLPQDSMNVLLLIGGPEITPIRGFMGYSASVESGIYKGQPVRAFLLEGADVTLPQALPSLVGWQPKPTVATARAAMMAPHPLIALDALRIAARLGTSDQAELLAQWLLHPAQPAGVRVTTIKLLGEAIKQMPQGSKEADVLIGVAMTGWEAERGYPIDAAYLRALESASEHVKMSRQLGEAIADDYYIRELTILSEQLANSLRK
jgi:hypothetical protein